jgi:Uma2 family endonuclease
MTYEEYRRSPEEFARYDIVDGWKIYRVYGEQELANPTRYHQMVLQRIARFLEDYTVQTGSGEVIIAPCDVLIRHTPLRCRQPDILYMSQERWAQNPSIESAEPLSPAPELVIEILSSSDTATVLQAKLSDYAQVEVRECWLISLTDKTVEIREREENFFHTVSQLGQEQILTSSLLPGLQIPVAQIFPTTK